MDDNKKVKASDHESYNTFSVIGFLLPIIGIVLGLIYLTKNDRMDRKLGEHMVAFSILGFIFWGIAWQVYASTQATNSIQQIQL